MRKMLLFSTMMTFVAAITIINGVEESVASPLESSNERNARALSCQSVLTKLFPSRYPHCQCTFGPYGKPRFAGQTTNSSCSSGKAFILEKKSYPRSNLCTQPPRTSRETICELTLTEKANNFIQALGLGNPTESQAMVITPRPDSRQNLTIAFTPMLNATLNTTSLTSPHWGKRRAGFTLPCPTTPAEKSVCSDITDRCHKKRSTAQVESDENEFLLAEKLKQQATTYLGQGREKRQQPAASRNVFFVLDSSGSIGRQRYSEVLEVVSKLAAYFCGKVAVGLLTYSRHAELELCPQCHRNNPNYHTQVYKTFQNARFHDSFTHTGEAIKCLRRHILPAYGCLVPGEPTDLVFFTDGQHNGCNNPSSEIDALVSARPGTKIYSISVGNIASHGVTDLIRNIEPNHIFNVENFNEFKEWFKKIETEISSGTRLCAPVYQD